MHASPTISTATTTTHGAAQPATARGRLVTDAPTRMFHWLFALSFLGAYLTADGERWRMLHVTLGYTVAGLLAFRVLYGFFGPRQAGLGRAKGILMLGEAFGAAQAEQWGLVWAVLEDEAALHAEARRVARRLAGADPALMGRLKAALHREAVGDLQGVLAREADIHWQMR